MTAVAVKVVPVLVVAVVLLPMSVVVLLVAVAFAWCDGGQWQAVGVVGGLSLDDMMKIEKIMTTVLNIDDQDGYCYGDIGHADGRVRVPT